MDPLRQERDALTRERLLEIAAEANRHLGREAARLPDLGEPLAGWRRELSQLPGRLRSAEVRIAFVGAVKSGKSTLVNALLGEDLLPRGSGILTAQVTAVRTAPRPGLHLLWRSLPAVNRLFSTHLAALGCPGEWRLEDPGHRALAAERLERGVSKPERASVRALLTGYEEARRHLGEHPREEHLEDLSTLPTWAARDEISIFLEGLRVDVPTHEVPDGVALLDCQGSDAWNAAHGEAVESALLEAHAVVYVVSSRVGLREADHRLLEALRSLGILDLVRFVLNVDLGESRSGADLQRVASSVEQTLEELGRSESLWVFSCLQGLLDRRTLLAPDTVTPGERRLLEAWESTGGGLAADSRDRFQTFRTALWGEARAERERLVIQRGRTDLRRILVEASHLLSTHGSDPAGIDRAAWEADTLDGLLAWARDQMEDAAREEKDRLRRCVNDRFATPQAPQRRLWEDRIAHLPLDTPDPGAPDAARRLGAGVESALERFLAETEPVRIHTIRNLALETRGALARAGEELGDEAARLLGEAGVPVGSPPDRRTLASEVSSSRKIPVVRGRPLRSESPSLVPARRFAGTLGRLVATPLRRGSRAGVALDRAELAARRGIVLRGARHVWRRYVDEVLDRCLLPHADDVAAQIYAAVATWVLAETGSGAGLGATFGALAAGPSADPATDTPNRATSAPEGRHR